MTPGDWNKCANGWKEPTNSSCFGVDLELRIPKRLYTSTNCLALEETANVILCTIRVLGLTLCGRDFVLSAWHIYILSGVDIPCSIKLHENLTVAQLGRKFPNFYTILKFIVKFQNSPIIVFTRVTSRDVRHIIHALLHSFLLWVFFIRWAKQVLVPHIWALPLGCAMLFCILDAQFFLQPQHVPYREHNKLWLTHTTDIIMIVVLILLLVLVFLI